MNDFDKAVKKIGNRFDFVLVATERLRELRKEQRNLEEAGLQDKSINRKEPLCYKAISDIENGIAGIEYLTVIRHRARKKSKF